MSNPLLTVESLSDGELFERLYGALSESPHFKLKEFQCYLDSKLEKYTLLWKYVEYEIKAYRTKEWKDKKISYSEIDNKKIFDIFTEDFLAILYLEVSASKHICCDIKSVLSSMSHNLDLLICMSRTPAICYSEDCVDTSNKVYGIFKRLTNLKQPFDDGRFRAIPIYVNQTIEKGMDRSKYLRNEKGSINRSYVKDDVTKEITYTRSSDGYYSNYLDAKVGVIFYFKDLPSILVSFNFDTQGNIFIHQIQCQIKDRGHYKLGSNWKEQVIQYMKDMFDGYDLHLISGDTIANLTYESYGHKDPEYFKPNAETLARIAKNYDDLLPESVEWFEKGIYTYRKIAA